ncbi:MAG: hypothetical protein OXS28_15275 [Gammaproteobacteria bacterium]|nr:hypothetical protein [Gammaproteobacteria bacterium]
MKSHDANTFRISEVLMKSCSLAIKNMTGLLILSVVLFLVLDFTYDSIEDTLSELIRYGYVDACIQGLNQLDLCWLSSVVYRRYTEAGGVPLFRYLSPAAFIFFSFLLPVAIIRLLFAGDTPTGSFIERVVHNYGLIASEGFIVSSFRYICAFVAQVVLFIYLPVVLGVFIFALAVMLESFWILGLLLLLGAGYIYVLFRFTAVFQLAYVFISTENLGIWQSWRRGYALSAPSWGRISTLFAIILPLLLLLFAGILVMLLPGEAPDGLGTLVSSHVINFLYVVLSAILSAVCYRELKRQDKLGI